MNKIQRVFTLVAFGALVSVAAGETDHSAHAHGAKKKEMKHKVHDHATHEHSQDLMKSMDVFLEEYMKISEYLAADNISNAKSQAISLGKAIHALKHKPDSAFRKKLQKALHVISGAKDLASARKGFFELSTIVIPHVKMMGGLSKSNLYFCPMAFGKGAQWLQKGSSTRNPYYGSSMLKCGSKVK